MLKYVFVSFVLIILSGCATSTPIQRYSESKSAFRNGPVLMSHNYSASQVYRVYQRGATGFVTIGSLRYNLEERAEKFCERLNCRMVVLGEKISPPPYILGNFPRIEIVFAAVPK
jgi:hypothetical protein